MAHERYTTEAMIQALRETNGLVSLAARRIGCDPNTIYARAKRVQSLQAVIDAARAELIDVAELSLRRAVVEGEGWAVALVLKTLGKHRGYVERQEIAGPDGGSLEVRFVDATSASE